MTAPGVDRYGAGGASPLEAAITALVHELVRREAAEEVRRLVREELSAGAGTEAEWLTQPAAGRVAGVAPQTIRGWQAAGLLNKGRRGRVNAVELRRFLAEGGAAATAPAVPELRQERARRAAQDILEKVRQRGNPGSGQGTP